MNDLLVLLLSHELNVGLAEDEDKDKVREETAKRIQRLLDEARELGEAWGRAESTQMYELEAEE